MPETQEADVRVEMMLDAAEDAGIDLWSLELRRRQLERDLVGFANVRSGDRPKVRRADDLRRSVELGVEVLASGFKTMASLMPGGEATRR